MSTTKTWIGLVSALSEEHEYSGAMKALSLWREDCPNEPMTFLYSAALHYAQKDYSTAIADTDEFLQKEADNLQGLMLKHILSKSLFSEAIDGIALKSRPDDERRYEPWYELGELMLKVACLDEAITAYRKAIVIHPDNASSWDGIAVAYLRKHRYEESERAFAQARQLADDPRSIVRAGILEILRGNLDEALEIFKFNLDSHKDNPVYWINFGLAYYLKKDFDNAEKCWMKLVDMNPHFPHAHYDLACLHVQKGDYKAALVHLKKAMEFGDFFRKIAQKDGDIIPLLQHPEYGADARKILEK